MIKRAHFSSSLLPYLLFSPQIIITIVFFIWPAYQSLEQVLFTEDAFGLSREFSGLAHFKSLWEDSEYFDTFIRSGVFALLVAAVSMSMALLLAGTANYLCHASRWYRTLLIIPYAVVPILAGALWMFLFDPTMGILANILDSFGINWNHKLNGNQAMLLVIIAASWNMVSYNFIFFFASMHAIPKTLLESAAVDGAGPLLRFKDIIFPLISPTTFFLLIMNTLYAFVHTFGIVHGVTSGGPGQSTQILIYKIFTDGFIGLNYGLSAAQSLVLIFIVGVLTILQFRYIERKVNYT